MRLPQNWGGVMSSGQEFDWDITCLDNGVGDVRDLLAELYYNQELSMEAVGLRLGCNASTVFAKMRQLGMKARPRKRYNRAAEHGDHYEPARTEGDSKRGY